MPQKPKIAVVTPVFNLVKAGRADFIKQCIESVHNQTYKNIEHIIQDGASTDGTLDILQEYADKGWIKLYSEKDVNINDAINKASMKTDAKYINILGGDDYYKDNDIVEYIVSNYLQDGTVDYVYGDEEQISEEDSSYLKTWYGYTNKNEFWRGCGFATGTMFFSKKIFEKEGMFDVNLPICADFDIIMKFKFNDYKCAYCERVVNVFRYGGGLSSSSVNKMNHTYEFAQICYNLWKKFDDTITPEKAEYMIKYDEYPEEFLMKLRRYIIGLKLKGVDYNSFNGHIENMISYYYDKKRNKRLAYQAGEQQDISGTLQNIQNEIKSLKENFNTSNDNIVSCKDDLKNTILELKNIIEELKEKNSKCIETTISFYPFRRLPLIKIVEEIACKKYYVLGIIPILRIWKSVEGE